MKKRIFSLLVLLLISVCVFAQAPEWQWATQAGGIHYDEGIAITIDDTGNSYVTGNFSDTASFGSYSLTSSGDHDIFLSKMDDNGNWLWATQAGGTYGDSGIGFTIDDVGNSYVTGCFKDIASFGSYTLYSSGDYDIFAAKIDDCGNWLWATQAGGSGWDRGNGITIDDAGNSYVTGWFEGTASFGSYFLNNSGFWDIFVAKIDESGNWLWATQAGGSDSDLGIGITIDNTGCSYVTGNFVGTSSFGPYSLTSSGDADIFVAKMDANGNWQWVTRAGGNDLDGGLGITIDNTGYSYVTGNFVGTSYFGPYSLTSSGGADIFVAKMDANGNWQWVSRAGGTENDYGYGITIDDAGNSYVAGDFKETATFGSYSLTSSGDADIFAAKMDAVGNWLWAKRAGGTDRDDGFGITIDDEGNSYITGEFRSTATFGPYSFTSSGYSDIFVAKLNSTLSAENEIIPTGIMLSNYPNPFNPTTTIFFLTTEITENTELTIYNLKGQKIRQFSIFNGQSSIVWDGTDQNKNPVSSGIYFFRLNIDGKIKISKKMILMK